MSDDAPLWLVGFRGHTARGGAFETYVADRGVTGAVWTPAGVVADDWAPALHRVVKAGAVADESLLHDFALTDIRRVAEALRFVWRDSGHADGWAALWLPPDRLGDIGRATEFAREVLEESQRPNVAVAFLWTDSRAGVVSSLVAAGVPLVLAGVRDARAAELVEKARAKGVDRARRDAASDEDEEDDADQVEEATIYLVGAPQSFGDHLRAVRVTTEEVLAVPDRRPNPWLPASQEQERAALAEAVSSLAGRLQDPPADVHVSPAAFASEVAGDCSVLAEVPGRLWARDFTLWRPEPDEIADRLGWLDLPDAMRSSMDDLVAFGREIRAVSDRVVLCGMGGSSLAPEVLAATLSPGVVLDVLDSTDPAHVASVTAGLDPSRTAVVVASKSGTTVETLSHLEHLWPVIGDPSRFVAVTDPGTPLQALARERGFRRVFENPPDIGGRFSALSMFGLVPAAMLGLDLEALLAPAQAMARRCAPQVPEEANPGLLLGAALAEAFGMGRDKLTLLLPPALAAFGGWVEQLVAESTGKGGSGVLPVVGEPVLEPEAYGSDRVFVSYALGETEHEEQVLALAAHHPVVLVRMPSADRIGAEFYRWEFAVAVLGHVLEINPFDQPDVEAAKAHARQALDGGGAGQVDAGSPSQVLDALEPPAYLSIQAFVAPTKDSERRLAAVRDSLRRALGVAVTVGFGPRFLHSTGQLHKGGPSHGVFLQVVAPRVSDVPIPGKTYTFGNLIDAQADGDLRALRDVGRKVARLSLDDLERLASGLAEGNG